MEDVIYHDRQPPSLLALPAEIRLQIYSYLLTPSNSTPAVLKIGTEDSDKYARSAKRLRQPYHVMGGRLRSSTQLTTYYLKNNPGLHPSILLTSRQIHAEAAHLLYSQHTFDFGCDVESVVPFLGDLTPYARKSIRHVNLIKRALPYTKDFDRCEWAEVCQYLASECELQELGLTVQGGKVPAAQAIRHAASFGLHAAAQPHGDVDMFMEDETGRPATRGFQKGDFGLISRFEGMEWVRQLCNIKGLRGLNVKTVWENCPPPCSNALAFFVSFSESIEGAFAEFLRENMVAGAA